jgi:hypothetical protein
MSYAVVQNPNEDVVIGFVLNSNGNMYKPLQISKEEETYDDEEEKRICRFVIVVVYTFLTIVLPLIFLRFF